MTAGRSGRASSSLFPPVIRKLNPGCLTPLDLPHPPFCCLAIRENSTGMDKGIPAVLYILIPRDSKRPQVYSTPRPASYSSEVLLLVISALAERSPRDTTVAHISYLPDLGVSR